MKPFKTLLTTWAFLLVLASGGIAFAGNDDAIGESPDVTQNQKKANVTGKRLEHILIISRKGQGLVFPSQKLLKLMGGSIQVKSELGKVSALTILLPINKGG